MAAQEIPKAGCGSKLLSRIEVAKGTMAFHFEKPAQFEFKPGQSADMTLSNPLETDSGENRGGEPGTGLSPVSPRYIVVLKNNKTATIEEGEG